jgi:thioredoxin 1
MQTIHTHHQIAQLKSEAAVLILFGGAHCSVCQAIKPQVEHLMGQRFPDITLAYVDCEQSPAICAQHQVFSLPAMKLYLGGSYVWRWHAASACRSSCHTSTGPTNYGEQHEGT